MDNTVLVRCGCDAYKFYLGKRIYKASIFDDNSGYLIISNNFYQKQYFIILNDPLWKILYK